MSIGLIFLVSACVAQAPPQFETWAGPTRDDVDWEKARVLFDQVQDGTFSFDDAAFYWLCEHVDMGDARKQLLSQATQPATPVRHLFERPADYRGKIVTIEGVLRSLEEYEINNRPEVGRLFQLELSVPDSRALATIVCTERPSGLAMGMDVRATGYFLKSRAFRTTAGETGAGVVLVAGGMVRAITTPTQPREPKSWLESAFGEGWMVGAIGVLLIAWLYLRRRARLRPEAPGGRSSGPVVRGRESVSGTDADFDWMSARQRDLTAEHQGPTEQGSSKRRE